MTVAIHVAPDITLYHKGPSLDLGPLPSFFYFSLSGEDSLNLDPFNQPIAFLNGSLVRSFSMTLPGHENELPRAGAIRIWADDFAKKRNPILPFLENFQKALDFAIHEKFVDPQKLVVGGLSRGGFVALHAAARDNRLKKVLAFAPITDLTKVREFQDLKEDPSVKSMNISSLRKELCQKQIRFHIGNLDDLVDTKSCFLTASTLAEEAFKEKIRSPRIEFITHPSIGYRGHGTPPEVFKNGVDWAFECL